ncbi:MAG: DUF4382 domain-containing protein [Proteobacteria bacterium]|nr:DUF4382 domain-containing protein [Pseudomonadota bacterium]
MKRIDYKKSIVLILFFFMSLFSMYGCSSDSKTNSETGDITIGLTDAQGDFITYSVNVVSLTLTHANGTVVETLPLATQIDFAQYVDMTEFLTAASVPLGAYKKATLLLDYSDAEILVEDSSGEPLTVSSVVDEDGNVVNQLEVDVYLENRSSLVVAPGLLSHITLDFDLGASNSVSFDDDGLAHVVVEPSLIAEVNHESPKDFRLRGKLGDVLPDMGYFFVNLRPFYHPMHHALNQFGRMMVVSGEETMYEIDGVSSVGSDGLALLAEQEEGVAIIVKGKMKYNPCRFEAQTVYVGSSVPGYDSDYVTGSVLSRDGNTLSVNGMIFNQGNQHFTMNDTVKVTVSDDTLVKKQQSDDTYTISDIAPGQHVTISGSITINDALTPEMDASQGLVRLTTTVLRGRVSDNTGSDYFNVNLDTISMRKIELFDFSGTGSALEDDADPLNYEVENGDLDISVFDMDDFVKVYGFVNAYGQAPYDFMATSIVNYNDLLLFIKLNWAPSTLEPFTSISDEQLVVNLEGTHLFHHLGCAQALVSLQTLENQPVIKPGDDGVYVIMMKHRPLVYTDFTEFVDGLERYLDGHNRAKKLFATGTYDTATTTLTARYLIITLR